MNIGDLIGRQRAYFDSGATLSLSARRSALDRLYAGIRKYERELTEALHTDLGKSATEAYMTEIGFSMTEISYTRRHLRKWMRPERKHTPMSNFAARSEIMSSPYGITLIISPWNYPFLLLISPLIGALAAGNCCVLKPSELAPATARAITRMIQDTFPEEYVAVVNGAAEVSQELLAHKFDYIFYTGSTGVGKYVMEAAARNLTPVTLELGGKSPVIITGSADVRLAARRILFGKLLNCGQTCIAPDYVLCDSSVHDRFVEALKEELTRTYGEKPLDNPDYGKIINRRHFDRIVRLIDPDKVVAGGETEPDALRIAPTIMDGVTAADEVMQEEIFGPVLPVIAVADVDEACRFIKSRPHPLALYLFTSDNNTERKVLGELQFGGGCVNDTISHIAAHNMPFGGVGASGIGSYHCKYSFDTFSHKKSIVRRRRWIDPSLRYRPYTALKYKLLRWYMR